MAASSNLDTLIEEHLARAYKYASGVARSYHHLDECDIRSAAHIALVRAASRYCEQGSTFWAYARHCVRGAVKDLARKPRIHCLHDYGDLFRAPSDNIEPRIAIRQLLTQLPERGRRVLVGYDLEGQTLRQIASDLGISASHVSKIRRSMLEKLRKRRCIANQSNVSPLEGRVNEMRRS